MIDLQFLRMYHGAFMMMLLLVSSIMSPNLNVVSGCSSTTDEAQQILYGIPTCHLPDYTLYYLNIVHELAKITISWS